MDKIGVLTGFGYGITNLFYSKLLLVNWNSINLSNVIKDTLLTIDTKEVFKVIVMTLICLIVSELYKACRLCYKKIKTKIRGKN